MLTDGDQSVVKMLRENVEANRSALRAPVSVQLLDWNVLLANGNKSIRCGRAVEMRGVNVADSGVLVEADVILAADCVYNPDTIPALVGALAILLKQMPMAGREPPVAHVVLTMRNPSTYASLLETLSHAGLVHNVRSADTVSDLAQSAPFHFVHDYDEDSIRWLEVRARADSPLVGVAAIR